MSDHIIEYINKKGDAFSEWKRKTILQTKRRGLQEIHKELDEFFNSHKEEINIDEYKIDYINEFGDDYIDEYKAELLQIIYAAQSVLSLSDSRSRYKICNVARDEDRDLPF